MDMAAVVPSQLRTSYVSQGVSWLKESQTNVFLFVSLIAAAAGCAWMAKKSKKAKLALPPGPRGLPLVGSLPFFDTQPYRYYQKLADQYGPIMKVQLGCKLGVVISSPSIAKEVLKDQDAIFANRDVPIAVRLVNYGGHTIAWSSNGPDWTFLRKIFIRELMGNRNLDAFYNLRRHEVRKMIGDLYAKNGKPINICHHMLQTLLEVMMGVLWGGSLDGEERVHVAAELLESVEKAIVLVGKANISDFLPILSWFDLQGVERQAKKLRTSIDQIFDSIINQKIKTKEEGKSKYFLQLLLQLVEEGDPKIAFTKDKLKGFLLDIIIGGIDTTSTTVEWAISELLQHPHVMKEVKDELAQVVGMDNIVEESHSPKLTYLGAVVKEVLRLHPVGPFLIPHSPSQSAVVGGHIVPKGAQVYVNVWAIQRDSKYWDNPLEFQPERFLNASSKTDFQGNDFRYIPFGSGRRICAAVSLAQRMLPYILGSLLHSFDWQLPEGSKLDLSDTYCFVLKKETPLIAIPTPRLSKPELYS